MLSELLDRLEDSHGEVGLNLLLTFLGWGYSPEQIVEAIVLDAPINGETQILDDDGAPLVPTRIPLFQTIRELRMERWETQHFQMLMEHASEQASATEVADPPTHAELAIQEQIPLTEGTWRFFSDESEQSALYDFAFEPTSRFYESGAEHNEGAYDVSADTVEMTLVRVATVSASDGTSERSEEIAWNEWFSMTRVGNTMTGTWTREDWYFDYDDGLVFRGLSEPQAGIFARPQRPDDAG